MRKPHRKDNDSENLRLLRHDNLEDAEFILSNEQSTERWRSSDKSWLRLAFLKDKWILKIVLYVGICSLAVILLIFTVYRKPVDTVVPLLGPTIIPLLNDQEFSESIYSDKSLYIAPVRAATFRDNLINTKKYVTASPIGGFSNQVMAQINLLYLAVLTGRVAVIADFVPGHMHGNPGYLAVSEVYDLARLAEELHMPIIEWSDIKNRSTGVMEEIGCWSLHATLFNEHHNTGGHFATEHEFSLDISLTPVPDSRLIPNTNHLNIMAAASLGWPEARKGALAQATTIPGPHSKHMLPPDEHMLCYDELYYAASVKPYEWFEEWVPAWTQVGKYMRWAPNMEELARKYIMHAFGLNEGDPFPAYISVHIRHTDFAQLCGDKEVEDCFPSLSTYGAKVDEIKADLFALYGLHVDRVLVASDEEDPAWWDNVREYGWNRIDWVSERTEEIYSEWYPIVLDSVALSLGKGFVGTTRSTLSLLASKRVQDWEGGFIREVHLESL